MRTFLTLALVAFAYGKDITPEQIHLAFQGQDANGNPSGMNVAWYTKEKTDAVVTYGTDRNSLTMSATGLTNEYHLGHGFHHNADMVNLTPNTTYYYQVGTDEKSAVYTFKTAPATSNFVPMSISIFGDMGWLGSAERPMRLDVGGLKKNWSAVPTRQTMEKLRLQGEIEWVWHLGDIGYADDAFGHDVVGGLYEEAYNGFMNWMQNLSANSAYMVSVGNHESECHSPECVVDPATGLQLNNFSAYTHRWHMPAKSSGGVSNMWYSWNYGNIHFVSINTETDFPNAPEETHGDSGIFPAGGFGRPGEYMAWLEADLKAAHEARTSGAPNARKWIVAGGHRPCCGEIPGVQELFDKYEVDLYLSGHAHTYARSVRTCLPPACDSKVASNFTTSFLYCGGTGSEETDYVTSGPSPTPGSPTFSTPELSSCLLKAVNETTLQVQLISSIDQRIIDTFNVNRN
eukprot:TRINITY_DN29932_c0_g1_i1.p1 TRINITY_DN29932_c0_g1~~TRINITY_DN29932_c0_g1_i1.p1  ORF type:complete len:459 (+),score=168.54 TRINITY_DN29932_c0_g1_i1:46-1422(+)